MENLDPNHYQQQNYSLGANAAAQVQQIVANNSKQFTKPAS
jgi:hypothetical protein